MFKLSPETAQVFGALGEGGLLVCPWLLDQYTMDLLSQAGYDPNEGGKIYVGFKLAISTIVSVLAMALTVGMVNPLVSIAIFLFFALSTWYLPNLILGKMSKH